MTATASPSRKEQAVQLRLAGLSRSQIADALGLAGGGEPLSRWLREIAVAMRQEGRSYREIRQAVGVAKSTLSLWLRDLPLSEEQCVALALRCPPAASRRARAIRASAAQRRQRTEADARDQISHLSESELFVAGVVAYWAEGTKNKPWRTGERVAFLNSDPAMIRLFLSWLRLLGVGSERLQYRVNIHESADVGGAKQFWAGVVGVSPEEFDRTSLKRHNPKTVRRNIGENYHGCLCVSVRRSADLNLQIAGWFEGISAAAGSVIDGSGVV